MRRTMVTVCAMSATIMQALDTTIANVALPYMQGSLSASLDQINWVLTSYIVASAIMTAPIGWVAERFGRKRLFIICAAGFTVASMLCGLAQNIEQMVGFRLLQGAFGAALVPLSQAVMLDSYSARGARLRDGDLGHRRDARPDHGPDARRLAHRQLQLALGVLHQSADRHRHRARPDGVHAGDRDAEAPARFDWFGFLALAVGIGSLQLMLDRGEQLGWFGSTEIIAEAIVSAAGFYYFLAHSLTTATPFVRFELFRDRNFVAGCMFMVVIGVVLFGTMALVTPFMQNVIGYPILTAGILLAGRGVGTLIAMIMVGRLLKIIEARYLRARRPRRSRASRSTRWSASPTRPRRSTIVLASIVQGFGLGLVFVPLSTVAFATLPGHLRTEGTAILTLVRNIGSSVGISMVIAQLTNTTDAHARQSGRIRHPVQQRPAGAGRVRDPRHRRPTPAAPCSTCWSPSRRRSSPMRTTSSC